MDNLTGENFKAGNVRYRQANSRDLPELAEIFLVAFRESVQHYAGKPIGAKPIIDALAIFLDTEPEGFLVAVVGNRIAGYIFAPSKLSRMYRIAIRRGHLLCIIWRWASGRYGIGIRPALIAVRNQLSVWWDYRRDRKSAGEARIFSVAVHPGFQGMGIGTGLVQAGLDYLASRGAGRVRLEVRPDNIVALRIYEKLGFKITGQTRDTQKDWLIMVKEMVEDVAT